MASSVKSDFDEVHDRFGSAAAKFHPKYLTEIFQTTDLYPFWIADQDFKSPPAILQGLKQRVDEGIFGYEERLGQHTDAEVDWFKRRYHVSIKKKWITHTPTIMTAMSICLELFTSRESIVLKQPPIYKEFQNCISKNNRKVIDNPLKLVDLRYELDFEQLVKTIDKTQPEALLFCNPHNPVGRVWTRTELQQLVDICIENNILIISDEIHADIVFKGYQFHSLLSFPEIHESLIVLYSPSKVFNIASISDALCIIPSKIKRDNFQKFQDKYTLGRPNALTQIAQEIGFTECDEWIHELNTYLEQNVKFICEFLRSNLPQLQLVKQEGTYLVWIDMSFLRFEPNELISFLAKEAKLGLSDGAIFGTEGKGFVRMNISCPRSVIMTAMENLLKAIKKLD